MNKKQLIEANNALRNELNLENKTYYESMLFYIRANLTKDEQLTEETLYEVLQHIIEVQRDGRLAADEFGEDPTVMAQEILEQLPETTKAFQWLFGFEMVALLLGVYIGVQGIPALFNSQPILVNVGAIVVKGAALVVGLGIIILAAIKMLKAHGKQRNVKNFVSYMCVFAFVSIAIGILSMYMKPFGPSVLVPNYVPALVGVILVGLSIGISKMKK